MSLSATVTSGTLTVNEGTVTFSVFKGATQIGTSVTSGTVSGGKVSASFTLPGGTAVGTYTIQAIYNPGPDFLTSSDNTHTLTVNPAGPALISTTVNGANVTIAGQSVSLAGTQRSMVDNIVFQFNEPVTLDPGAFTIALHAGVSVNGGAAGTVGTLPTLSWTSPDGGLTWVVTFSGAGVVGGSIADGDYDITVVSTAVHANGQTMTSNVTNTFFRLFGDTNGDGQVSGRPDLVGHAERPGHFDRPSGLPGLPGLQRGRDYRRPAGFPEFPVAVGYHLHGFVSDDLTSRSEAASLTREAASSL